VETQSDNNRRASFSEELKQACKPENPQKEHGVSKENPIKGELKGRTSIERELKKLSSKILIYLDGLLFGTET